MSNVIATMTFLFLIGFAVFFIRHQYYTDLRIEKECENDDRQRRIETLEHELGITNDARKTPYS